MRARSHSSVQEKSIIGNSPDTPRRDQSAGTNGNRYDFDDLEDSALEAVDLGQVEFLAPVATALPILPMPSK
jgi:hypothetical protein